MDLVDDVPAGAKVGLDTAPLIYWMEGDPVFFPVVQLFFQDRLDTGVNEGVTSVVSLAEVLVQPFRLGRTDLLLRYRTFSLRPSISPWLPSPWSSASELLNCEPGTVSGCQTPFKWQRPLNWVPRTF